MVSNWMTERYGAGAVFLGDRGTSLLFQVLKCLGAEGSGVIVPSTTCHAVAFAVSLAGYIPVFADVELSDLNVSPRGVRSAISSTSVPVTACIAIHSFGHLVDAVGVKDVCDQHGVLMIEDICQIMGSGYEGCVGDIVLTSFGYSKPVDAGGGGAMLIRDRLLARRMQASFGELLSIEKGTSQDEAKFREVYYTIREQARNYDSQRTSISELSTRFRGLFLRSTHQPDWKRVGSALNGLDSSVARRRERATLFSNALNFEGLTIPQWSLGSSPWRFNFLINDPSLTRPLTLRLREAVGHVSNWYPSLAQDFGVDREVTPNSYRLEESIVNLWIDDSVDDEYVSRVVETVDVFLEG
jgi:dTDP-4-amino-4,6-dideoxygalactose transaminase